VPKILWATALLRHYRGEIASTPLAHTADSKMKRKENAQLFIITPSGWRGV